ncbi:MAG: hypothetical protein L6R28_23145 [Planctomycetes bacterium]|nr:hypothetical protein [Planctomycetota bacterium]
MALLFVLLFAAVILWSVVPIILDPNTILPETISVHGHLIDKQVVDTLWITGVILIVAHLGLMYTIWKSTKRDKAEYLEGNNRLEITWTVLTGILFVALNLLGQPVWAKMHLEAKPKDAIHIDVIAKQFSWMFHYPGPDGKRGARAANRINDATGNSLGLDEADEESWDDVVSTSLVVPVDTDIVVHITSRDVLHALACPALRIKQDAVPGLSVPIPFRVVLNQQDWQKFISLGGSEATEWLMKYDAEHFQKKDATKEESAPAAK